MENTTYFCDTCQEELDENEVYEHSCYMEAERSNEWDETSSDVESQILTGTAGIKDRQGGQQEEKLIALVFKRRPLWDHTFPLSQWSKCVKDKLWVEIQKMMNGVWSLDQIQRKWKSLKDRYLKLKTEFCDNIPTGSGRDKARKITWKYYEMLTFLSDVNVPRSTISSLYQEEAAARFPELSASSTTLENIQQAKEASKPSGQKKKRNLDEEILDAIKNTTMPAQTNNIQKVNPICIALSDILTQLPPQQSAKLEIALLKLAYEYRFSS